MKAKFKTEKVEYVVTDRGYERNGHFVLGEVRLISLSMGEPAVFEVNTGRYTQQVRTDVVLEIMECPLPFKKEMSLQKHPYKVKVLRKGKSPIIVTRIGTESEVREWANDRWKDEEISLAIIPIPTGRKVIV